MIVSHLILGFVTSYIGFLPPSMLNITAGKISLESEVKTAQNFALGVSFVVLIQVFLAIFISSFLESNPEILERIKKIAIVFFAILSAFLLYKSFSTRNIKNSKPFKNGFLLGISLSFINLFSIPFFAITHSAFVMHGWAEANLYCTLFFVLGTVLGAFSILSSYIFIAQKFEKRLTFIIKYSNLFIGIIIGFVALFSASNLYL